MKFTTPAGQNPIDQMKVVGKPHDRIDGKFKTTGTAPYAYERHDVVANPAYGYIVGAAIAKGRIDAMHLEEAKAAPGVITIVTSTEARKLAKGDHNTAMLLGGPEVQHYHQAIAIVIAETFEQARAAAALVRVDYARGKGRFDLDEALKIAPLKGKDSGEGSKAPAEDRVGKFESAFASAGVKLDARYTTPDHSHAMMEPHASLARWDGDKVTIWTSNQMINWGKKDLAKTLGIPADNVRLISPYVGGGFGGKLFLRADAVLAALGARAAGRPVKVTLTRPMMFNNTTHRPATTQRIRIGAGRDGKITAIAHGERFRRSSRRRTRDCGVADQAAVRRRQPPDVDAAGRARFAGGQCDARAGRSAGPDGARDRDGRNGREARHGPDRLPRGERHAGRSREARASLFATSVDQVHAARGREVRLGQSATRNPRRSAMGSGSSASAWRRVSATT